MLKARWWPYTLDFTFEARTSRGSMWHKPTYFIEVWHEEASEIKGVGECNLFPGLSSEWGCDYEAALDRACASGLQEIAPYSSLIFGIESALADLTGGGKGLLFPGPWTQGGISIPINGLVWMGSKELMTERVRAKIEAGFRCIKLKIGGINFDDEIDILAEIRKHFSPSDLEIRLDANGAFTPSNALSRLERLSKFGIHSIEQPIRQGQYSDMARICKESPIDIALDEELIGIHPSTEKREILSLIRPSYIILKAALCGGFSQAKEWIDIAQSLGIGWWATSALESNIGLSAIAQWTASLLPLTAPATPSYKTTSSKILPQGLGTGALYSNNLPSPILQIADGLLFNPSLV